MAPDDRYRIVQLAEADSVDEAQVLEFWEREGAMPPETARERVREVEFIGLDERGGVAAVSSAYLQRSERLGMDLWHYRTFVGRGHRRSLLAENLTIRTRDHLEDRFVSGEDTRAPGIFIQVENEVLKTVKNEAVWPDTRFVFIGEDGVNHYRVYYFPGALAPPPISHAPYSHAP